MLSLLEATIQANLASIALLKSFAFLNPRPPRLLGWQSLSEEFQAMNLPTEALGFHQNLLDVESSLSQILAGMLK